MSSSGSRPEPDGEPVDGDSAGVYYISVEDFEARKPPRTAEPSAVESHDRKPRESGTEESREER